MITLDEYLASKGQDSKKWINSILKWRWNTLYPDFREELQMSPKELANNLNIFAKIEEKRRGCGVVTLIFYKRDT